MPWYQSIDERTFELESTPDAAAVITPRLAFALAASLLVLAQGCAASPARGALAGEEVLARGGELREAPIERAIRVTPELVSVWGITEVPAGSRLQTALAGVDAITRAELLKAVEVRVSSVVTLRESSTGGTSVLVETREAVTGILDRAAPLPHGWAHIRRDGREILRLWARLDVPRQSLETALSASLSRVGHDPHVVVEGLELATSIETAP